MSVEIVVPQVGEAISAARLVQWYKKEGDFVKKGEPLFAVDTDKAVLDVEAFSEGILEKILVTADNDVQPEMVVGLLRGAGEATNAAVEPAAPPPPAVPAERAEPARVPTPAATPASKSQAARVAISPKARQLARELGVDIARLAQSLSDKMITEADIRAAAGGANGAETTLPLTRMREVIAMRTQRSKQLVPHFYLMADVDMTAAIRARESAAPKYSLTVIIAQACAKALQEMPDANVYYSEQGLRRRASIDIGIAVSVEGGLLVPVIRNADSRSLGEMDLWLKDVRPRIERGRYRQTDLGERSLTISNLGMHAVDRFIAIIDTPDPAILAVGAIQDRAVVENGTVVVRPMCTLTLSVDHRAMDGADGARLLGLIRRHLEQTS